jgi:hypothetical protein
MRHRPLVHTAEGPARPVGLQDRDHLTRPRQHESGYERGDNEFTVNAAWSRMAVPLPEDEGKDDRDYEDALN